MTSSLASCFGVRAARNEIPRHAFNIMRMVFDVGEVILRDTFLKRFDNLIRFLKTSYEQLSGRIFAQ